MISRAVTPRTKMIIVNTPHNPIGKVFTRTELEQIAAIAEEFNLLVMSDEVVRSALLCIALTTHLFIKYDCLVYDGKEHVRIANLPGMWDRTVTVGSAGSRSSQFFHYFIPKNLSQSRLRPLVGALAGFLALSPSYNLL